MLKCTHEHYHLNNLTLLYIEANGILSFTIVPKSLYKKVTDDKFTLEHITKTGFTHVRNEPMVQLALSGDVFAGEFSAGHSMKNASSCYGFKLKQREKIQKDGYTEVISCFTDSKDREFEHHVRVYDDSDVAECFNVLKNSGKADITVEMLSSFSITGLSPFCADNDTDNILIHRFKSSWSAEGKHEVFTASELQFEDSWSSFGYRQERIGQRGTMPCRSHMPFYAVEDKNASCVWAVSMEAPLSWQMDAIHHQGSISLTGGIADFNYGHNRKTLKSGDSYTTMSAFITAKEGSFLEACANLTDFYGKRLNPPKSEETLPVIYNDYCCTWGNPSMQVLKPFIDECARLGISYFVTDVGWWKQNDGRDWNVFGDWNYGKHLFPNGIDELSKYITSKGMKAGIWFEFENLSPASNLYRTNPEFLLTRDGVIVQNNDRVFLDFRKEEVRRHVYGRVIEFLRDNGFGYIKIDYNENIGVGVDGAESLGEGLRAHMDEVLKFFVKIREELPETVMEVCSSGGMRLEPKFLSLGSMASFSDAHLGVEGAAIAIDLHRYMHPKQMQIWATLNVDYSLERIYFTIAKGMLGRYCVSGDIVGLAKEKKKALADSLEFYRGITRIIADGDTLIIKTQGCTNLRHISGSQYLVRFSKDKKQAVLYYFSYNAEIGEMTIFEDFLADYDIKTVFSCQKIEKNCKNIKIALDKKDYLGGAILLTKGEQT